jgi:endonuclease/exonuclease/phosphatase family metal-dependent hydrolase
MPADRHAFTAMTFNVRYDEESDGDLRWANRRALVFDAIRANAPDLLAVQEPTPDQSADIAASLPGMTAFGAGLVRAARFDVQESGAFEVSATGARTCAWTRLRDRLADRTLIFASTHFDTAEHTWLPSAIVVHGGLDALAAGLPIVLAGDFNCAAGSDAHRYLLEGAGFRDTWYEAGRSDAGVMTYNGFTPLTLLPSEGVDFERFLHATSSAAGEFAHYQAHVRYHGNYRIDWILARGALACTTALVDTRHSAEVLPSDHYPVVARLRWQ